MTPVAMPKPRASSLGPHKGQVPAAIFVSTKATCGPCLFILRDLCLNGGDPRLCELYVRYAETGDTSMVQRASAIASASALDSARNRAVEAGIIPREAILA